MILLFIDGNTPLNGSDVSSNFHWDYDTSETQS